jgi:hypothetical protein
MAGSVPIVSAISVLCGALLCGLGYWVILAGMATSKSRMAAADGVAVLPCIVFVTILLVTPAVHDLLWIPSDAWISADGGDLLDWIDN